MNVKSRRLKIAFLSETLTVGGAEKVSMDTIDLLVDEPIDFYYITNVYDPSRAPHPKKGRVEVIETGLKRGLKSRKGSKKLVEIIQEKGIDVLIVTSSWLNIPSFIKEETGF